MRALSTAATGMAAQEMNVEVISNNIANMNTVGFKRQRAEVQDLLYQDIQKAGAQSSDAGTVVPTGIQIGSGVKAGSIYRITQQGSMTQTGNTLDLGIQGVGYLQVQLPSGETAYTRAGNLSVNNTGQIVTDQGYPVLPAMTIPTDATAITISPSGQVQVTQPGNDHARDRRPAAACHLHQRGRPGSDRREPVLRVRRLRARRCSAIPAPRASAL